ncbi:MAG: DNA polymerase III subunit alpha, partial [Gammaproteobacteria bacterium]|nr:DNA polymerase III subunit alpha [Gammaproteobacteria bacterium]
EAIVAEREAHGPFTGLHSFCRRVDVQRLNRRAMEALIRAGALDALGPNRASLMAALEHALRAAEQDERSRAAGQDDLFAAACPDASPVADEPLAVLPEWRERDRLTAEKEALGLYLTGHPFEPYVEHCRHFTTAALAELGGPAPAAGQRFQARRDVVAAGLVVEVRRRGGRLILVLDDGTGRLELSMFEEAAREYAHLAVVDEVIVAEGNLRFDEFIDGWRLAAKVLYSADACIETHARRLLIRWDAPAQGHEFVQALRETLAPWREGACDVCVEYRGGGARGLVSLGGSWRVRPSRELREQLGALVGEEHVQVLYPGPVAVS